MINTPGAEHVSFVRHLSACNRSDVMVKTALFVRLEAKPGKEQEVEAFLMGG